MLLSVIVYNHKLTPAQWLGAAIVFAGISVEAYVKRKGIIRLRPPTCPDRHHPRYPCQASRSGEGKAKIKRFIASGGKLEIKEANIYSEKMAN
jgi:hypothetical protein